MDGLLLKVFCGETVAAGSIADGHRVLRRTTQHSVPIGIFCGVGGRLDCSMIIDKVGSSGV